MRALQKEVDDLQRDEEQDSLRARYDAKELVMLRERCERFENERVASGGSRGCVRVLFFRPLPVSILIVHFWGFSRRTRISSTNSEVTWKDF
jgi:hypothetical protein